MHNFSNDVRYEKLATDKRSNGKNQETRKKKGTRVIRYQALKQKSEIIREKRYLKTLA